MGVVTARLLFLAFLVMTATIIYNALYLQEDPPHGRADALSAGQATTRVLGVAPSADGTDGASERTAGPAVTDVPRQAAPGGESRLVVRAIQRELSLRGYDVGPVDGQMSEKTRKAIAAFQMRAGVAVTGVPSDDVLRQILLGDTIGTAGGGTAGATSVASAPVTSGAPGVTGSVPAADSIAAYAGDAGTILRVQQVLAELGYAPGVIDGAWGHNTAEAVRAFQRDRNMAMTGTITPELLAEFQRVTGRDFTRTAARP